MLLIGASKSNVGKTELACSLIRRFSGAHDIVGVKVTAIRPEEDLCPRGKKGCGVCLSITGSYMLTEETSPPPGKDTARLLEAGAERVYWLRVLFGNMLEGLKALTDLIGKDTPTVCESNSLRTIVNPGLFLMVEPVDAGKYKPSALRVKHHADRIMIKKGGFTDADVNGICIENNCWGLKEDATAVILAGGKSSRLGRDKALVEIGGKPLIECIRDRLKPNFTELLISANDPEKYAFLGEKIVPDSILNSGPLGGIEACLESASHDRVVFVPCDVPDFDLPLLRRMLADVEGFDGVVPVTSEGMYEPLFAVYRRSVLPLVRESLDSGRKRVIGFYESCRMKQVHLRDDCRLRNLNTPEDFKRYENETGNLI